MCKKPVDKIVIYSTTPVMKVVGEAEVEAILVDSPETIWKKTKTRSGIDKSFFDQYYKNRRQAVAYKLKNVVEFEKPRELKEYGISAVPQSFRYIKEL